MNSSEDGESSASERMARAASAYEQLRRQRAGPQEAHLSSPGFASTPPYTSSSTCVALPADDDERSVMQLQTQLENVLREAREDRREADARRCLLRKVQLIASEDKDELIAHLIDQVAVWRQQCGEAASTGEKIASQLVRQQHEMRLQHRAQVAKLQDQVEKLQTAHPDVERLEARLADLHSAYVEQQQQLRFAVQKLRRSRHREQELRKHHDPFWDI